MHRILNNHNRRLLDELNRNSGGQDEALCNCIRKEECPLGGWCNSKNVVYQACMQHNDEERIYIGIFDGKWKQRMSVVIQSFFNLLRNQTTLSKYFWNLKDQGLTPQIKWKIILQSSTAYSINGRLVY